MSDASLIVDSHLHIIDPERFPYHDGPGYRPLPHEYGAREELFETLDAHGVRHALAVQPSCYGCDNTALLDAIAASGGRIKGIAVVDSAATDEKLRSLKDHGVVGIRLNLEYDKRPLSDPDFKRLLAKVRALDWWVEVHAGGPLLIEVLSVLRDLKVNSLVDHWGRPVVDAGPGHPDFQALLRFGPEGRTVVKLSAPYRISALPSPYSDLDLFAEALLAAFSPQRCVWGSDWPFLATTQRLEYGMVQSAIGRWLSGNDLQQVLWATPARLFGFT